MTPRALFLLAMLSVAAMPLGARAEDQPLTKLKCDDGKGNRYSLSFSVERSRLGALPEGCEIDVEKKYEPPSFVTLQIVKKNGGLIHVGVGSRSPVPDVELVSEWRKKADSLCPAAFKAERAPAVDESRSREFCGGIDLCDGFRLAVGAIRCEGAQ